MSRLIFIGRLYSREEEIMKKPIIVMNFSHIYEQEQFYRKDSYEWLDMTDVAGTNCYLDAEAAKEIRERIEPYPADTIHFIDSGNYHYMSKYWLDKITQPFVLILFDHHPDMQPTLFENFISCGCWVKNVLDENPMVKKVVIVGAKEELLENVEAKYKDKVICYSESDLNHKEKWKQFAGMHIEEPVYISVDKDVLCPEAAVTNWDQGSLSLKELKQLICIIAGHHEVVGVDICGECSGSVEYLTDLEKSRINDHTNYELLELLEKHFEDISEKQQAAI